MGRKVSLLGLIVLLSSSAFAAQRTDRLDLVNGTTSSGMLDIYEDGDSGSNKTRIQTVAMAGDITYSLPPDDGDGSEVLTTDGSGVLTWETTAGAGDITRVGDCLTGDCFTGTSGSDMTFNGSTDGVLAYNGSRFNFSQPIDGTRIGFSSAADATFSTIIGTRIEATKIGSVTAADATFNTVIATRLDGAKIGSVSAADATFTNVNVTGLTIDRGILFYNNTSKRLENSSVITFDQNHLTVGASDHGVARLYIKSNTGAEKTAVFDAASAPSANIMEWRDDSANILNSVGPTGAFDINSGTIDGTKIGASSAADATFSTIIGTRLEATKIGGVSAADATFSSVVATRINGATIGAVSAKDATFTAVTPSNLTASKCVQTDATGKLTSAADACGSSSGGSSTTLAVAQVAHGFVVGNVIKNSGSANTYAKAQSDSAANSEVVGIVTTVADADNFTFTTHGIITAGVPTATAGSVYFLSPSSAGALTATDPTTTNQVSKPVLVVLESAARALFINYRGKVVGTSGGLTVGNAVTSGTANRVLYEDGSNIIAEDADLAFDGTTLTANTVDINAGAIDGTKIGASSSADATFSNATATTAKFGVNTTVSSTGTVTANGLNLQQRIIPFTLSTAIASTTTTVGQNCASDNRFGWPATLTNFKVVSVTARASTAAGVGTFTANVRNRTDGVNVLSTAVTIDATELSSTTAATPAVIDQANNTFTTDDDICFQVSVSPNGILGVQGELVVQK